MKKSNMKSGDMILRSGKRLFPTREVKKSKRIRVAPVTVVDTEEHRVIVLDDDEQTEIKLGESMKLNGNGSHEVIVIDDEEQTEIEFGESMKWNGNGSDEVIVIDDEEQIEIKLGESKKLNGNESDEVIVIDDEEQIEVKLGESNNMILVDLDHNYNANLSKNKQFGTVYTRKRKSTIPRNSTSKSFKKKVRISDSNMGFAGNDVLIKGPVVFVSPSSSNSNWFSCFVSSVLTYMRNTKVFSWRRFSSFLQSDPITCVYSSTGIRVSQDSTCDMSHGFFKISGSVHCFPLFTVNFNSLPLCFLYMHSSFRLKYEFLSCNLIIHPRDENITKTDQPLGTLLVVKKARSIRKRVPRVSLFKKRSSKNLPIPGVREVKAYAEEKYVKFRRPDLYITSKGDEMTRILETKWVIYDMDCGDEEWLKKFNNERFGDDDNRVSEDTFEKIIGAFERESYFSGVDYLNVASAIDLCLKLASKDVLESVYSYWMNKRKKKRSLLVAVFKEWRKKAKWNSSNAVLRKKQSMKRRMGRRGVEKELDFLKAILNKQKKLREVAMAIMKVHETQQVAKWSKAAAMVKRQAAQALMETADLVTYRATLALRIAEARAHHC